MMREQPAVFATLPDPTLADAPAITDFGPEPHRFHDPLRPGRWTARIDRLVPNWRPSRALVDHYRRAHFRGDPAADALVRWMHGVGMKRGCEVVELAIERGLAAVPGAPAEVRAFFEEIETIPPWLDRATLARACELAERVSLGQNYVLFSISLLAGYASAGVTKTLAATGELEAMAPRRVAETSQFVEALYASRTIERDSEGFKTTIRVRLMHAFVRHKLLKSGWDTARWGIPINQADMASTVLSFSVTYLIGLRMLGFVIPRREREALIHLWRYVGGLMGVDATLLPATEKEGLRFLWLVAASQTGPDEDGRALASALLGVPAAYRKAGRLGDLLGRFDAHFCAGFTRSFVGNEIADDLALPDTAWKYAFLAVAAVNLCGEAVRLAAPNEGPLRGGRAGIRSRVGKLLNEMRYRSLLGGRPATFQPRTVASSA